jgi:ATP-dependent RNA helicase RhlE
LGEAISLVCIDEVDLLRGIQRMLKRAIPWTVENGFVPDRTAEPRPLGMRTGHARVGHDHHAHRKPVRRRTGAEVGSGGGGGRSRGRGGRR